MGMLKKSKNFHKSDNFKDDKAFRLFKFVNNVIHDKEKIYASGTVGLGNT